MKAKDAKRPQGKKLHFDEFVLHYGDY